MLQQYKYHNIALNHYYKVYKWRIIVETINIIKVFETVKGFWKIPEVAWFMEKILYFFPSNDKYLVDISSDV